MTKEELLAMGLTEEQAEKVAALAKAAADAASAAAETAKQEKATLQAQLQEANGKLEAIAAQGTDLETAQREAADWKQKYETMQQEQAEADRQRQYSDALTASLGGLKFTSEGAKKAFLADAAAKGLPVENGKLLGFDDFVKGYRESDPGAFAPDKPQPQLIVGGADRDGGGAVNPFHFNFTGIRDTGKKGE